MQLPVIGFLLFKLYDVILHAPPVIHIASLAAALVKLDINIPIEDIIKAIHDEDETRRVKLTADATQHRTALSKLALQPTSTTDGLKFTIVSRFVPKPTKPANVDPLAKERRRRLLELTKQSFPDGKVPDPFTSTWLGSFHNQTEGKAMPSQISSSVIHFRPQLPNGVTFIILGQHALLNRLQYQVQPVSINSQLLQQFPQRIVKSSEPSAPIFSLWEPLLQQCRLVTWCDPASDGFVPL